MDLNNQTCDSLKSQWGCCAGTLLPSIQYCQWTTFANNSYSNLFNCSWDVQPCGGLDWAWNFCGYNVTNSTNNNNGSSSSSSSGMIGTNSSSISSSSSGSGIVGSNSSSNIGSSSSSSLIAPNSSDVFMSNTSSSMSGSSSHSLLSSHSGGIGTNHTSNNTASAKATISWTMTIALVLAAANVVN
jgi:hypothetical protein